MSNMFNNIFKHIIMRSHRYFTTKKLPWSNYEEIADILNNNHPLIDPLQLRFHELHNMVSDIVDNPNDCSEAKLEAIQMAWVDLKQE